MLLLQGPGRHTAEGLARRLEVSLRTVYRDLDALSASGVPVTAQRGPGGGVALLPGWRTQLTGLTGPEVQALAALPAAEALEDVGLSGPLRSGLVKLAASLPAVQQAAAEHARQRLHVDGAGWFGGREAVPHLATLREAVFADRQVRLAYRDFEGRRTVRVVSPYGLVIKAERWYLVAGGEKGPAAFRGARVEHARLLPTPAVRPEGFDLSAFWKGWCRRFAEERPHLPVTLRLTPAGAEALAAVRPPAEQARLREAPRGRDGRVAVALDFEREAIALAQLLPLGAGAEVLAPEGLRARLAGLAGELHALYAPRAPRAPRTPRAPVRPRRLRSAR
jgi:predicted DNA-binding transcriptional regulator YafY